MVTNQILKGTMFSIALSMLLIFSNGCNSESSKDAIIPKGSENITLEMVEKAPEAKNYSLKSFYYKPTVNEKTSYKVTQINSIKRDNLTLQQTITHFYTKTVRSVKPDGTVEIAVKIDSLMVDEKGPDPSKPGNTISLKYNSNDSVSKKNPEFVQYNSIVGAEVMATVSKFGKVEEVLGLNSIVNQMLGSKKDSVPAQVKEQLIQQVKAQFFQMPIQQEYQTYPDNGKMNSSKSWTKVDVIPMSGILTVTNTVTYQMGAIKEVNGRKVAIIQAKLTAETKIPEKMPKGIEFSLESSTFEGTGTTIVDVETGATLMKNNDVLTKLKATVKDLAAKKTQPIDQEIQTTVTVAIIR